MDEKIYLLLIPFILLLLLGAGGVIFYIQIKADRKRFIHTSSKRKAKLLPDRGNKIT